MCLTTGNLSNEIWRTTVNHRFKYCTKMGTREMKCISNRNVTNVYTKIVSIRVHSAIPKLIGKSQHGHNVCPTLTGSMLKFVDHFHLINPA